MRLTRASTRGIVTLVMVLASAVATTAQSPMAPSAPPPGQTTGSPMPGSAASPIALPDGDFVAGTTYFVDDAWGYGTPRLTLTVPAPGWSANGGGVAVGKGTFPDGVRLMLTTWRPVNLYADPCHWRSGGLLDPPMGPTVDDLATALVLQAGDTPSIVSDVTIDGYPGKKVELSWPDGLDVATCDIFEGDVRVLQRWLHSSGEPGPFNFGNGQANTVYILDISGTRAVIDTFHMPIASDMDLAELEALVDSIRIEAQAPPPSPVGSPSA